MPTDSAAERCSVSEPVPHNATYNAVEGCPTHAVCPPCREGWGHWNGHEYVPTIQSETTRTAGCDGRDISADVDSFPEKIGPRCGELHVIEISREGWDRPVRLCRRHADQAHLTDMERATLDAI